MKTKISETMTILTSKGENSELTFRPEGAEIAPALFGRLNGKVIQIEFDRLTKKDMVELVNTLAIITKQMPS